VKKILATMLGVILATGAVSALADRQDRANLAQCKADIGAYFGEDTRARLQGIKRSHGETHMRLIVTPESGSNRLVICSVSRDGASSLADRHGVAVAPLGDGQAVSLIE
jgi:hypothetical protein